MKTYYLAMFFLLVVLAACSTTSKPVTSEPSAQTTRSISKIVNTLTPIHLPTLVHTPTAITASLPFHPIPTSSKQEKTEITLEMLRTNNGCDLPCWWGITPNETTWSDAQAFLKPFSKIYERQPPSEWFVYDVMSPISRKYSDFGEVRAVFAAQHGVVKEVEINSFDEEIYHLSTFLREQGVPETILLSTYSSDSGMPSGKVPMTIALYYLEKGIMATYATDADVKGGKIKGCLEERPTLFLWSPDEYTRSIDYILGWDKNNVQYSDIQKSTGLDIQDFYDKYRNLKSAICLETPASLWPSQ